LGLGESTCWRTALHWGGTTGFGDSLPARSYKIGAVRAISRPRLQWVCVWRRSIDCMTVGAWGVLSWAYGASLGLLRLGDSSSSIVKLGAVQAITGPCLQGIGWPIDRSYGRRPLLLLAWGVLSLAFGLGTHLPALVRRNIYIMEACRCCRA
jgi:hypothetical protein